MLWPQQLMVFGFVHFIHFLSEYAAFRAFFSCYLPEIIANDMYDSCTASHVPRHTSRSMFIESTQQLRTIGQTFILSKHSDVERRWFRAASSLFSKLVECSVWLFLNATTADRLSTIIIMKCLDNGIFGSREKRICVSWVRTNGALANIWQIASSPRHSDN